MQDPTMSREFCLLQVTLNDLEDEQDIVVVAAPPVYLLLLRILLLLLVAPLPALSFFLPAIQSHWANIVDDQDRAQVFSASSALIVLCVVPAGSLAGLLYATAPIIPFLVAMGLQGGAWWLIARAGNVRVVDTA